MIPLAWVISGNIRGPQGAAGAAGSPGAAGADGSDGADGTSVLPQGDVATYGNLPGGLGAGDAGRAWVNLADGCLYIWDGAAFPTEGTGPTWRGPQGSQGAKGDTGDAGADGAGIEIAGSVPTYAELPDDLDAGDAGSGYMVAADGKLYIWDGSAFPSSGDGVEFRGPKGDKGDAGDQGIQGIQGIAGNDGADGADGSDGSDGATGATGARGSKWFTGAGSPSGVSGSLPGDMYMDTTNGDV